MKTRIQNGFTIVEVLMSVVLLAMLMTAVAFAFDASVKNYKANEAIYETVKSGRLALLRITGDLRTATGYFDGSNTYVRAVEPIGANATSIIVTVINPATSAYEIIRYRLDAGTKTLYLDKGGSSYVLCKNVNSIAFNSSDGTLQKRDNAGAVVNVTDTRSVRVVMSVSDDTGDAASVRTVAAATLIRRNM